MERSFARPRIRLLSLASSLVLMVALGGCALKHPTGSLVQGKVLFVKGCGSCHTLAHAQSAGITGPNLDDAFRQDRSDGVKSPAIDPLLSYWIQYPNSQGVMPAGIYRGQDAEDVAAYVGAVASIAGKDTGQLATAGGVQGTTAAAGKQVFTGVGGCGSCHTLADAGTHGVQGPDLNQHLRSDCASAQSKQVRGASLSQCIYTAITKPYAYLPAGYKAGIMPANFKSSLTKSELTALVNYLTKATQ